MKNFNFIMIFLAIIVLGCTKSSELIGITDDSSKEDDYNFLEKLLDEIEDLAGKFECQDASEWKYTTFGIKACGGPAGYIAYSTKIDTSAFLEKVRLYTEQDSIFINKWKLGSDCSVPPKPKRIVCENGKPKFIYK